jgi:hypothetical protein
MKEDTAQFNQTTTNREGDLVYYDVPVTHFKRKVGKYSDKTVSMKDRIRLSKNVDEINALVEKGINTYKNVSDKTINQWKKTANIRIQQLTVEKAETKPKMKRSVRKSVKK